MCETPSSPLSRRDMLKAAVAGAGALALSADKATLLAQQPTRSAAPTTPDQALKMLMQGNERFTGGRLAAGPNRSLARLKSLGEKQTPFASILGCADSRVPVELLFDQGFGDLFVCRVAGNIATSEVIGSLEYGTLVLGSKVLMVLGHTACGAVAATVKGEAVPGQIGSLYPYIHPAAERVSSGDLTAIIKQNVRHQVTLLRNASPVIKELIRDNKLQVVGAVFDFHDGRVTLLET